MRTAQDFRFDPIGPDELTMIDGIFKSELQIQALSSDSDEAEALAAKLIRAYQSGVRDPTGLIAVAKSALRPHRVSP
ncbi:hypothetical protein QN219_06750 [Sinorhizobium sp. 7-81]|uniref:hypothetical protein n=1 Tax=Sinorhizobium sp. 8-89 TaxID=3049089 RepID=UPI0024C23B91|nr:hypothetical protein [Sinorhizobium sp. 8-89]MDK1489757.1 hypothetical protein [Sinorhizobium sp. 8-89]